MSFEHSVTSDDKTIQLEWINEQLGYSDRQAIAESLNLSPGHVRAILKGKYPNSKTTITKIVDKALEIIESRQEKSQQQAERIEKLKEAS